MIEWTLNFMADDTRFFMTIFLIFLVGIPGSFAFGEWWQKRKFDRQVHAMATRLKGVIK